LNGQILEFAKRFKDQISGSVLDVGSFNVNGSLKSVLPVTFGIDMRKGPGVDEVLDVCGLVERFGPESFDHVVSADALEHIEHWRTAMEQMWAVLKPGGLLLLTMASPSKGRHAYPDDYWRMPIPMFLAMFGKNEVLGSFDKPVSMGAVVRKSGPLMLDFEPNKVP
jgi:SAM-dependent methyltransferase